MARVAAVALEHEASRIYDAKVAAREAEERERIAKEEEKRRAKAVAVRLRVGRKEGTLGKVSAKPGKRAGGSVYVSVSLGPYRNSRRSRDDRRSMETPAALEVKEEEASHARADSLLEAVDEQRLQFDAQRALSLKASPRSLEQVLTMAAFLGLPYGGELGTEQGGLQTPRCAPAAHRMGRAHR